MGAAEDKHDEDTVAEGEGERSQHLAACDEWRRLDSRQGCEVWKVGTEVIDIEGGVNEGEEEIGGWWWITQ